MNLTKGDVSYYMNIRRIRRKKKNRKPMTHRGVEKHDTDTGEEANKASGDYCRVALCIHLDTTITIVALFSRGASVSGRKRRSSPTPAT